MSSGLGYNGGVLVTCIAMLIYTAVLGPVKMEYIAVFTGVYVLLMVADSVIQRIA